MKSKGNGKVNCHRKSGACQETFKSQGVKNKEGEEVGGENEQMRMLRRETKKKKKKHDIIPGNKKSKEWKEEQKHQNLKDSTFMIKIYIHTSKRNTFS